MKCHKVKERLPEYVLEHLDSNTKQEIEAHLLSCENCNHEMESLRAVWSKLETIPEEEPTPALSRQFYSMLDAYQHGLADSANKVPLRERLNRWLQILWQPQPAIQFIVVVLCLVVGALVGYRMGAGLQRNGKISQLHDEILEMRRLVSISLLNQSSPSDRLRGVSWSQQVNQPNETLISTLINTLNTDPNVNVRLAAVDAIYLFSDNSQIRAEIIKSLAQQDSPLVQITLIDLLVSIKERKSLDALKKLINDQQINPIVKKRAQWGVEQLI